MQHCSELFQTLAKYSAYYATVTLKRRNNFYLADVPRKKYCQQRSSNTQELAVYAAGLISSINHLAQELHDVSFE